MNVIVNVRNHVVSNAKGTVCLSNVQKHFYNSERCNKIKTNILSTASKTMSQLFRSHRHHPWSSNQYSMKSEEIWSQSTTRVVWILEVKSTLQSLPKRNPLKKNDTKNLQLPVGHSRISKPAGINESISRLFLDNWLFQYQDAVKILLPVEWQHLYQLGNCAPIGLAFISVIAEAFLHYHGKRNNPSRKPDRTSHHNLP